MRSACSFLNVPWLYRNTVSVSAGQIPPGIREKVAPCRAILASQEPQPDWVDDFKTLCVDPCMRQDNRCQTNCTKDATCISACYENLWQCTCRCEEQYIPANGIKRKHLDKAMCLINSWALQDVEAVEGSFDGLGVMFFCVDFWNRNEQCGQQCSGSENASCEMDCTRGVFDRTCRRCLWRPVHESSKYLL